MKYCNWVSASFTAWPPSLLSLSHTHTHTHMHILICAHLCTCACTHTHTHTHIPTPLHILTHTHTLTHTHIHTYTHTHTHTHTHSQVNMLVTELKSEALKDRHWKLLMKKLRVSWQMHDLTLGQVCMHVYSFYIHRTV